MVCTTAGDQLSLMCPPPCERRQVPQESRDDMVWCARCYRGHKLARPLARRLHWSGRLPRCSPLAHMVSPVGCPSGSLPRGDARYPPCCPPQPAHRRGVEQPIPTCLTMCLSSALFTPLRHLCPPSLPARLYGAKANLPVPGPLPVSGAHPSAGPFRQRVRPESPPCPSGTLRGSFASPLRPRAPVVPLSNVARLGVVTIPFVPLAPHSPRCSVPRTTPHPATASPGLWMVPPVAWGGCRGLLVRSLGAVGVGHAAPLLGRA